MNRLIFCTALLTMLLLLGQGQAHADYVTFSYDGTISPQNFGNPDGVQVVLTSAPAETVAVRLGSNFARAITEFYYLVSSPFSAAPLHLNAPIDWILTLTDQASGQSARLDIAGRLEGPVGPGYFGPYPSFTNPPPVRLGNYLYRIMPNPPRFTDLSANGGYSANITVTLAPQAPEPSGLALGASALVLAGCRWLRRRQPPVLPQA
jgi:hypothetical protein